MRTGDVIDGRYELEDARGSGSGGVVWTAFDRKLKRRVALKRPHAAADDAVLTRFRREAETAAQVHHPNAISVFDTVDTDGCWLVMEYLPAESLDKTLAEKGALPPERVARIGVQIAGALAAVHARNIVHRDVKPGNILVTDDDLAKLTDFGISLWREVTLTDDGRISGTPAYTSPEVARGYPASQASDVFSLGATLFAAVEGTPPFGTGEPYEVLERVRRGEILPIRQAGPLAPLLAEMLRSHPARRPTADEVRARLKDVVADWEPPPPPVEHVARRPFRRRPPLKAAAVVLVVVAVGTTVFARQHAAPAAQHGLVGDERTADPCALIDKAGLRRFGPTRVLTTYGNFNRCDALIDVRAQEPVDVEVQLITRVSRAVQGRPLEVVEEARYSGECDRTVVVDDRHAVRVTAKLPNPPLDLCAVADVATGAVLEVLRSGPIPRRAIPFPEGSLAHVDACALLDDKSLATLAGVDGDSAVNVFGNWACKWFSTVGGRGINLRYDQHPAHEVLDGELVELGGHAGYLQLEPGSSTSCTVSVPHLSQHLAQRSYLDVMMLTVTGDRPGTEYCPEAKSLAAVAAGKLPS
ncbi:serine/threonine-protein kinase [Saccharothrix sp. NRRL B-16314]|uniref:serine/threonine-protein kinase n=1 Tax=Saccharothrix sp. NRRL B-16314 TaxID=1463825 RepID=UPI0005267410|nr:serine/threonine-protein kinase [Saccharothrix sp. NRRL B-16314]